MQQLAIELKFILNCIIESISIKYIKSVTKNLNLNFLFFIFLGKLKKRVGTFDIKTAKAFR